MSNGVRIKLGLKTHKGILGAENQDRFLVGMDPASNDWLYSPDEISVGEMGTLLFLADGLDKNQHGAKAANLVSLTIKKLFDEMLELPPDPESMLALLKKFFVIANQQLILKAKENPEMEGFGCSGTLLLIHNELLYLVWSGNCRVYRYRPGGVAGSWNCPLLRLEQLNADHSKALLEQIRNGVPEELPTESDDLFMYFGLAHQQFQPGTQYYPIAQGDKILLCSEGLFQFVGDNTIQTILMEDSLPDIIAEDLVSYAYNAKAFKNISSLVIEVKEAPIAPPLVSRTDAERILHTKSLLQWSTLPESKEEDTGKTTAPQKEQESTQAPSILKPMKVRTVLPDDDALISSQPFPVFSSKDSETSKKSAKSEDSKEAQPPFEEKSSPSKNEGIDLNIHAPKGKPRIRATVYPDLESDKPIKEEESKSQVDVPQEPLLPSEQASLKEDTEDDATPFIESKPIEAESDTASRENQAADTSESIEEEKEDAGSIDDSPIVEDETISHTVAMKEVDEDLPAMDEEKEPSEEYNEWDEFMQDQEPIVTEEDNVITNGETIGSKTLPSWSFKLAIALLIVLLLSVWICRDGDNIDLNDMVPSTSESKKEETPIPPVKEEPKQKENEESKSASSQKDQAQSKVEESVKEEAKKSEEKVAPPPPIRTEPNYDEKIKANKQQLTDEVLQLTKQKKNLCRQIETYKKNAPAKKQERIQALWNDCDQLEKKFNSIFDSRTKIITVERYDFLNGTLNNIKKSMELTEEKFENLRAEQ